MFHLSAFGESIAPNSSLINAAAISDDTVFTSGDDLRVPADLPFLIGEAALVDASGHVEAQLQSPSLRRIANHNIAPVDNGLLWGDPLAQNMHPESPTPLQGDEAVNFLVDNTEAVAALHYCLVWFGDGPQNPVTGPIYTIRATGSLTAIADEWVNGSLTFGIDLPVGQYNIVGMRAEIAGGVAARLNFVGGAWRPGVPAVVNEDDNTSPIFRMGRLGVFGQFHTNTPPTIDVLAAAGAVTPVIYLDIMPV